MDIKERIEMLEKEVELLKQIIELKDKQDLPYDHPVYPRYLVYPSVPSQHLSGELKSVLTIANERR